MPFLVDGPMCVQSGGIYDQENKGRHEKYSFFKNTRCRATFVRCDTSFSSQEIQHEKEAVEELWVKDQLE